jgi:predicted acyl esterase
LADVPGWEQWALDLYTHGDADAFWLNPSRNFEPYVENSADVPTMYAGSWYDSYSLATVQKFAWFKDRLKHQYLMMGPGIHGGPNFDNRMAGEVDMGPRAPIAGNLASNRLAMMLAWYDRWLKDVSNDVEHWPKVRLFVMGGGGAVKTPAGRLLHGGQWRDEADWPLSRSVATEFFLAADGSLVNGVPPVAAGSAGFVFDPAHPLPTIAGNVSSLTENLPVPPLVKMPDVTTFRRAMVIQGAADQVSRPDLHGEPPYGPLSERPDTLVYTSAPLTMPMEVTGPVSVELFMSTDVPDTDLFAMLLDVYPPSAEWPDGYRMNITDAIMRVRYRHGMATPTLLSDGEVAGVAFDLFPTSNLFAVGHRIQLLVSSSSFPRFDVNPNTGEAIGRHTHHRIAHTRIHHGGATPSCVRLEIVPHTPPLAE